MAGVGRSGLTVGCGTHQFCVLGSARRRDLRTTGFQEDYKRPSYTCITHLVICVMASRFRPEELGLPPDFRLTSFSKLKG